MVTGDILEKTSKPPLTSPGWPQTARLPRQVLRMLDGSRLPQPATEIGRPAVVVELPAEIDITNQDEVYDALTRTGPGSATLLIADASGTVFCDCAGVNALIRAHYHAAAAGAQLRLAANPTLLRILTLTDTSQVLRTYPSVDTALDGEPRPGGSGQVRRRSSKAGSSAAAGVSAAPCRRQHRPRPPTPRAWSGLLPLSPRRLI